MLSRLPQPAHMRCLVLDIDDTLFLERDYVSSGFHAVASCVHEACGVEGFYEAAWTEFVAGQRGDIFNRALRTLGIEPAEPLLNRLVAAYRSHAPTIALLSDAREALAVAHRTYRLAIVSDGPLESQRAKATALNLEQWAAPIILTEHYGPAFHKPSVRAFQMVQDAFAANGRDCCYVGDNPAKDFLGPKALGWHTVRVRRPQGLHAQRPSDSNVDRETESLANLDDVLQQFE